jgi:hypothetical protein
MLRKKILHYSNLLTLPILLWRTLIQRTSHPKPRRRWRDKLWKRRQKRKETIAGPKKKNRMAESGPRKSKSL